jgi:hypothetical protein
MAELEKLADRLSEASVKSYQSPYEAVVWPEAVDPDAWYFSPELMSLYGTPAWDALDEAGRKRLSFWEAVNFFSLNIHGEKPLIEGLAHRLYKSKVRTAVDDYLHHFLDEENKHSVYFGGFCQRYAKIYRSRHVAFGGSPAREVGDLLFFAKVLLFEEHADRYNVLQSKDSRLHPLAVFINAAHHADESRHLVFNRAIVQAFWDTYRPSWDDATIADIRATIEQFFLVTWREYYNPDVYADAGFADPWQVAEDAWNSPAQRAHRRSISAKCLRFFISTGLLLEEPRHVF